VFDASLFVKEVKRAFEHCRELSETENLEKGISVNIRGTEFRASPVLRSFLAQYTVLRYEQIRAQLRNDLCITAEVKNKIANALLVEIDRSPQHEAWITASRTPTTDKNIKLAQQLRDNGQLAASNITAVEKVDGKFRVRFAPGSIGSDHHPEMREDENGPYRDFDIVVNCSGRSEHITGELENELLSTGLLTSHWSGEGLAVDKNGKTIPAGFSAHAGKDVPLFNVSTALTGDSHFPSDRKIDPLSTAVAQSVLGMRLRAGLAAKEVVRELKEESDKS
jgi:hypothetical protein